MKRDKKSIQFIKKNKNTDKMINKLTNHDSQNANLLSS